MAWSVALLIALLPVPPVQAGPAKPAILVVIGDPSDGRRLESAVQGASVACRLFGKGEAYPDGVVVRRVETDGTEPARKRAFRALRKLKPLGVVALPPPAQAARWWKASKGTKIAWASVTGVPPDALTNPGAWIHIGPTPTRQGIEAADRVLAPLAGRRVGIVHEPTPLGYRLAAAFLRNRGVHLTMAGTYEWPEEVGPDAIGSLKALEADWLYVAATGRYARSLVGALRESTFRPKLLFCDGVRDQSLLEHAQGCLEGAAFLDAPDAELEGRLGQQLYDALDRGGLPFDAVAPRAFEAARRLLTARAEAGSSRADKVMQAMAPTQGAVTTFGQARHGAHGAIERFRFSFWRVRKGAFELWPPDLFPTEGCGPPVGFGRPPRPRLNPQGKIAWVTYGEGEDRTIESDLLAIGLSTQGKAPAIDKAVRDEVLARAIRIANILMRREADGTPVPGWSWGMAFTAQAEAPTGEPNTIWKALVAEDDPAAGGRAFGTWVAIYSTFLMRTMYRQHALKPMLSPDDAPYFDGRYRWSEDRGRNRRLDEIRCRMDGFASAIALTMVHEYGHCCSCDHDQEHKTSIMNVVDGAGAAWEDVLWIPRHAEQVTRALGVEGPEDDE